MPRVLVVAAVMAALSACASAPAAPDASPSDAEPSASVNPARGLPPGCATIDLRSPTGERVDLTGEWAATGVLAGDGEVAWLKQIGDCVYGSVVGAWLSEETIANLSGRARTDFRIGFDVVIVTQPATNPFGEYSTLVMVIEWDDDGRIRLREDRDPEETASRCPQGALSCPAPVIWYRVDEHPAPS